MSLRERRATSATTEIRKRADDDSSLVFTGHAAVFNERTWIGPKKWGFWEQVDAGFFRSVLDDDAAFLVNHDPNIVLARNPGTLSLSTDKRGLVADADFDPADPDAVKWAGRVRRGDVSQMSFAFTVREDAWEEDPETGEETRTLLTADRLFDVSLVTYPAYDGTDGSMRDAAAEVVKRHRGVDPRQERSVATVIDLASSTTGTVEPGSVDVVIVPAAVQNELVRSFIDDLNRRHRFTAKRLNLPL